MPAPGWLRQAIEEHGEQAGRESWGRVAWELVVGSQYKARQCTRAMREGLDAWEPEPRWTPPERAKDRIFVELDPPDASAQQEPIDELIASRIRASRRKLARFATHARSLTLPAEPVGLFIMGDPHVDNEGCDWATLKSHIDLIDRAEGVLVATVGDVQDNWIGRLARLYANASVSASDGWRLSEWLMRRMDVVVGGNHDAWAHGPGVDPMGWLTRDCGVQCYAPDELRITLQWEGRPDLEPLVWLCRHDVRGRSWFHPTHGPHKEAMLDGKVHLVTAGHIHQWGELVGEQRHGRCTMALRVRGYKRADEYAKAAGFPEQQHGEAVLVVVDPRREGPGRMHAFYDIEQGLDYLAHLRR